LFNMDSLISAAAQYLPILVPVVAGVVWIFLPRRDKVALAVQAVVSLVIVAVLIHLVAAVHADPRPFVVDPSIRPLFPHSADNGFPSDHTALASTAALLVMSYRRSLGAVLLAVSMVAGAARVLAQVHHVQDIVAAVLIAALAVGVTIALWRWARPLLWPRQACLGSAEGASHPKD
jgi:undecaprenyl-diphosphatase